MAGSLDTRIGSFILDLWRLLRGNAAQRFAVTLVRSGTVLAAGPPLYLALALNIMDRVAPPQQSVDTMLAVAAFILGLLMIVTGIAIFHYYHAAIVIPDNYGVLFQEGWPFEGVVRALLDGRFVAFENFTQEQLDAPVRGQYLECGTERNAVLLAGRITTFSNFPSYELIQQNGTVTVKAIP